MGGWSPLDRWGFLGSLTCTCQYLLSATKLIEFTSALKRKYGLGTSQVNRLSVIVKNLGPRLGEPALVLDVGVGHGGITKFLAGELGFQVTAVDIDPSLLEDLDQPGIRTVMGDITELKLDERFDGVIFAGLLDHLLRPDKALARANAMLTRGGWLMVSVGNAGNIAIIRRLLLGEVYLGETPKPVPWRSGRLRLFTFRHLEEMLLEGGFRTENQGGFYVTRLHALLGRLWPSLFAFEIWAWCRKAGSGRDVDALSLQLY